MTGSHIWTTPGDKTMTLHCHHCGGLLTIALPVSVDEMSAASGAFVERHKNCPVPRREDFTETKEKP